MKNKLTLMEMIALRKFYLKRYLGIQGEPFCSEEELKEKNDIRSRIDVLDESIDNYYSERIINNG